jgi:hemerythrin-like metal-binding protein
MRPFKWSRKNEMFVPELDEEHRNLFRLADELHVAITTGVPAERARTTLEALLAEMEEHFQHEERLMRAAAYASYEWHKQQHDTLRKRARQFTARFEAGEDDSAGMLLEFMRMWLNEHTAVADRMLGASLRNYERLAS